MGTPPTYLGVVAEPAPGGVRVTRVTEDSPAAKAGLKADDVITAADKKPVKNFDELGNAITAHKPGEKMVLSVLRDKKPLEITATLSERPDLPGGAGTPISMDFFGEAVPAGGVRVTRVQAGSAAARAGLQVGDVIEAIDKKKIKDMRDVIDVYRTARSGAKVSLQVKRDKEAKTLTLEIQRPRTSTTRPYTGNYGGQRENVQGMQGP